MADMAKTQIAPAVEAYAADVARAAAAKKSLVPDISCAYEIGLVKKLSALTDRISVQAEKLEEAHEGIEVEIFQGDQPVYPYLFSVE